MSWSALGRTVSRETQQEREQKEEVLFYPVVEIPQGVECKIGEVLVLDMLREPGAVLEGKLALVIRQLYIEGVSHSPNTHLLPHRAPTMEFVKVAGTAIHIHQITPLKNSFPLPLTSALTSLPSSSATYRLIKVLTTKNAVCDNSNRAPLLRIPGMTIRSSRHRFRKNSALSSACGGFVWCGVEVGAPTAAVRADCTRVADFCSEMALRIRLIRARKRVR